MNLTVMNNININKNLIRREEKENHILSKMSKEYKMTTDKVVINTYVEGDECKTECGQCFICRMAIRRAERKRNPRKRRV